MVVEALKRQDFSCRPRNLVGIAGKPHASTVIAVIGPATAKTAEEHGLRVDVLAPEPSVEVLVDALADFGEAIRLAPELADAHVNRGVILLRRQEPDAALA